MKREIVTKVRALPKPVRWGVYGITAYVVLKIAMTVLSVTLSIVTWLAAVLVFGALIAAFMRKI